MLDQQNGVYASYALKRFPVDKLKIDRAFITGLPYDKDDAAITHSIIDVAHNLGLTTVAEGIETKAQQRCLVSFGCHQMQGYLLARPLPVDEIETLLPLANISEETA